MAARSISSLTISFGLVAIPVKLYPATQSSERISFNLLHAKDGSRLKQQYICLKEGTPVERDEIVKGYEFAKDQYVMFTNEEIKALEEVGSKSVDIVEFVPYESLDPTYVERTYYVAPDKGTAKPYALLVRALEETKRCAIGHWAARGQQHMVALRPVQGVLAMHQLLFAAELRAPGEIEVPKTEVREAELKLARQLIEAQASDRYDPSAYTDEVKARVEAAIQRKVEGQEIKVSEAPPETGGKVIDLMAALRASLEKSDAARGEAAKLQKRKPPKRVEKPAVAARRTTRKG